MVFSRDAWLPDLLFRQARRAQADQTGGEIPDLPKRVRTCQIVPISIGGMGLRPQAKSMRTARAPLAELIFDMRLHAGRVGSE
jgi:hypothetical protein